MGSILNTSALQRLWCLQEFPYELAEEEMFHHETVLITDLYLRYEKQIRARKVCEREAKRQENIQNDFDPNTDLVNDNIFTMICNQDNIHHKAIFDAINEALEEMRPYGLEGMPMPWSNKVRTLTNKNSHPSQRKNVLNNVLSKVTKLSKTLMGTLLNSELKNYYSRIDEENIENIREERLAETLGEELTENEPRWLNYSPEEDTIKIDLSDLLFNHIIQETAELWCKLENRSI